MPNIFINFCIAPYRVDAFNSIHKMLNCEMYFMSTVDPFQSFDMNKILSRCEFEPHYLQKRKMFGVPYYGGIWKLLRSSKAELAIVPEFKMITIFALLYKYLFNRRLKVVSMCDDSYAMASGRGDFTSLHKIARKLVTPWLDDLLLVDYKTVEWYKEHYGKGVWSPIIRDERIEIPIYRSQDVMARSNDFNSRFGLKGRKVLLYVGRMVEVKNLSFLIDAIGQTTEDFVTVLVGDGVLRDELKAKAAKSGKEIVFAGRYEDNDIRAWFNVADVFVLPSYIEPFGAVTNEALLAGAKSLISDACGSTCLIDEHNGKVVSSADSTALARDIDAMMASLPAKGDEIAPRESLMNVTFDDVVNGSFEALKA